MVISTSTISSKVGIIYSVGKKHVRAHVYVDSDNEWDEIEGKLPVGLAMAYIPISAHYAGHHAFYSAIATALGHSTITQQFTDPRCVVIDSTTNIVEQVILADDSFDNIPGKILINHQRAGVGHTYNPKTKQFTKPPYVLRAKLGSRNADTVMPAEVFT